VSFQYRYMPMRLYDLYLDFKEQQQTVYVNTAAAVIANVACNYSAYTFFSDKAGIAMKMQDALNSTYNKRLFANVEAFQISQVELPVEFQQAIVRSIATKQNITAIQRYKDNMQVTFAQNQMEATLFKQQTIALANGTAQARLQEAQGKVRVTELTVSAEMTAYSKIARDLNLTATEALDYIWWDTLEAERAKTKEFLVGVDPAAYISQKS